MRPGVTDPQAARVLVHGTPVAPQSGRADHFFLTPEAAEAARAAAMAAVPVSVTPSAAAAAAPPVPIDQLLGGEADKPAAQRPVAAADPAASPPGPRARMPARPAARQADGRQQPNRAAGRKLRPTTPRDSRPVERRLPPRPAFDPFGIFR
jgi:hypothetical protein